MAPGTTAQLLGSRRCLQFGTLWPIAAAGTLAQAAASTVVGMGIDAGDSIELALAYWVPALLIIWLLGLVVARPRAGVAIPDEQPTARTVVTVICIGGLLAIVPNALVGIQLEAVHFAITWSVTVGVESIVVLLGGILLLRQRHEHHSAIRVWQEQIATVQRDREGVAAARATMLDIAREALDQARQGAQRAHDLLRDHATTADIGHVLDEDVRGHARAASHRIHDMSPARPSTVNRGPLWWDVLAAPPNFLLSFGLAYVLGMPLVAVMGHWPRAQVLHLAALIMSCLIAMVTHRLLRSCGPATATLVAMTAGCTIGAVIVVSAWTGWSLNAVLLGIALAPTCLFVTLVPNAWQASTLRGQAVLDALSAELAEQESLLATELVQFEMIRESLVSSLHTTIQGQATAAMVALEMGVEDARILTLLTELGSDTKLPSNDLLADVIAEWSTSLNVAASIDPALTQDERSRIARHVGEALLNAVRHGHAQQAQIDITKDGDTINLTVVDDGSGPALPLTRGLGSTLAQRESGSWDLQSAEGAGAVLRVSLPA